MGRLPVFSRVSIVIATRAMLALPLILLSVGCVSSEYQQLTDQGVQIGEEIYAKGVAAGSTLALDNLEIHKIHLRKVGSPETVVPYTPESQDKLAFVVGRQIEFRDRILSFLRDLTTEGLGNLARNLGIGWLIPGLAGIFAVWKKKQGQVLQMKDMVVSGIRTVEKFAEEVKSIRDSVKTETDARELLSNLDPKAIAKDSQEALGIRPEFRKLLQEYEKAKGNSNA